MDFDLGQIRIDPGKATKNRRGKTFPMIPELREMLTEQWTQAKAIRRKHHLKVPFVFFYPEKCGHPVGSNFKDFMASWHSACKRAGVEDRRPHDFRRTSARRLDDAGVPRRSAKQMIGHQTDAMYNRYNLPDPADINVAAAALNAYNEKLRNEKTVKDTTKTEANSAPSSLEHVTVSD